MMGDMSISPVAVRRAAGRQRGRTGWVSATAITVAALLGVGACSAGGSSSGQAASSAAGSTDPGNTAGGAAATAPKSQQQGVLLVNPGGPGGSGLSLAAEVAQGLSPDVAARYDIVGFDPRGVGSSVPALSCDRSFFDGPRPNYIPANPAAEQVLINRAKTYAADCGKRFGWLLPHMTTEDTARDMDAIRAAFGVSKISYYAFSYGTYLGQVYATLFPDRVRRMVLDSVVDPTGVWYTDNVDQDYAFQGRMEAFFAWLAKYDGTYHLGSTAAQVQAAWYRARNRSEEHTSELQSQSNLVCRLLLEKKKERSDSAEDSF